MYSPTTSPTYVSSFLKEESLVTIDFLAYLHGGLFRLAVQSPSSRCPISFVSLLNSFRLAAQSFSPRC